MRIKYLLRNQIETKHALWSRASYFFLYWRQPEKGTRPAGQMWMSRLSETPILLLWAIFLKFGKNGVCLQPLNREVALISNILQEVVLAMFRRKVPELLQMSAVECGAACLAMILSYYGRKTSIAEIHNTTGVGRDGLSALSLVQTARRYGLKARTISLEAKDFRFVNLPAIVFWGFNHFLIVERWSPSFVDVVDPAVGRERLTAEVFDENFTGIVMMLEPGMEFDTRAPKSSLSLSTYLLQYLKQSPFMFVQIALVSLLLQAFGLVIPFVTKLVIDRILPYRMVSLLPLLGIGLPLILLAQLATMLIRSSLLIHLQARIDASLTSNFFEHLLKLPLRFFQQRSSGDIMARVASNTTVRNLISSQLVSTILDGSMVILYLVILLSQAFVFGSIALVIGLLQVLLLM